METEGVEYKLEGAESSNPHFKTFSAINSRLLVRRDPLYLVECLDGTVERIRDMPAFLSESPLSIYPELFEIRSSRDDLLKIKDDKIVTLDCPNGTIPGVWSGRRSCLTIDSVTGNLYKLKGVAVAVIPGNQDYEEDEPLYLEGGQFLRNAHNERIFSDRFNRVLADNGVEPTMEYVGYYKSPFRVRRHKIAASVIRVKGDTRLDELMYALEFEAYFQTTNTRELKAHFSLQLSQFYWDIGFVVGQLKKLMDKSDQSWSDNPERTNAHIGNVVIYPAEENNLAIGLVDFDASCDFRDKSKEDLLQQQNEEYGSLLASSIDKVASARAIGLYYYPQLKFPALRFNFGIGFMAGYEARKFVKRSIEAGRLQELKDLINFGKIPRPRLVKKKPVTAGIRDGFDINLGSFLT
ncbi:MAG TPA: hypothetical protein VJA18_00260 [Candidatus Nanoarchaeia archaeon]|nr:hypothetical protein [Candidatus Nanoarchaeia archaeon]